MVKRVTMKKSNKKGARSAPARRPKARRRAKESLGPLATFGQAAGTFLGGPVGGQIGKSAASFISRVTGFGDYKVSRNSISMGNSVPTFQLGGEGVRICHREFLADIKGSALFNLQSFSINPGLTASFPYLAAIASQFEESDAKGLLYEYRPTSGTAVSSTNSSLGVVIMATDYDATNPPFASKKQMESYEYSTSTVPFNGCLHPIECARPLNVLSSQFVRTGPVPPNSDLRLFDIGNFQIATEGMQSDNVIGELWVTYDFVFRKPRINPTPAFYHFAHVSTGPSNVDGTALRLFGPAPKIRDNYLGITIDGSSPNKITIPFQGTYFISVITTGNMAGIVWSAGDQVLPVSNFFTNGAFNGMTAGNGTQGTLYTGTFFVSENGVGPLNQITFEGAITSITGTTADLTIFRIPDHFGFEQSIRDLSLKRGPGQMPLSSFDLPPVSEEKFERMSRHVCTTEDCCPEIGGTVQDFQRVSISSKRAEPVIESCGCEYSVTKKGLKLLSMCTDCRADSDGFTNS